MLKEDVGDCRTSAPIFFFTVCPDGVVGSAAHHATSWVLNQPLLFLYMLSLPFFCLTLLLAAEANMTAFHISWNNIYKKKLAACLFGNLSLKTNLW